MPTDQKKVNIFLNALLSRKRLKDNFLDYLVDTIDETMSAIVQGQPGVLNSSQISILGTVANKFDLNVAAANKVVVGGGQVITLPNNLVGQTLEVDFENANGATYQVAIRYAQVADDVGLNAKRGVPEYQTFLDTWGEVGNPDSVPAPLVTGAGTGTNLRLYVDAVCEAGVTHAGRSARVWLTAKPAGALGPKSSVPATAFRDLFVQFDGTNNYVDIPYSLSTPPLGQDVSANPPSVSELDYQVLIKGPTVRKNSNLRVDANYAFIGIVDGNDTGGGVIPATFDLTDQKAVFLITLDRAYDGIGSGAGRFIDVDQLNKPVAIQTFFADQVLRPDQKHGLEYLDTNQDVIQRWEQFGRVADVPRFKDDFFYSAAWLDASTRPAAQYTAAETGALSLVRIHPTSSFPTDAEQGVLELKADIADGDDAVISGPFFRCDGVNNFPRMYMKLSVKNQTANWSSRIGLFTSLVTGTRRGLGFEIDSAGAIRGLATDGATDARTAILLTYSAVEFYHFYAVVKDATTISFWVGRSLDQMTAPVDLDITSLGWDFGAGSLTGADRFMFAMANSHVAGGVAAMQASLMIDYWEFWTGGNLRSFQA